MYQQYPRCLHSSVFPIGIWFLKRVSLISFKGEETMKKSFVLTAVVSLIVGVLAGVFFTLHTTTPTAQTKGLRVSPVVEHANTDTGPTFHPPNMSVGELPCVHN